MSAAGDWSQVKVWYAPLGDLGTSANPAKGFIYSGRAPMDESAPPREPRPDLLAPIMAGIAPEAVAG